MYLQTKFLNKRRKQKEHFFSQWRKNKDTDRYFKKLFQ